ncbi:unnamed protein product [Prunus armeniaca]|uniref:NB-ARC domain-containing protein n=1 Tax=Prunus armeniaca TaxID=36596 RepID=A0A6J5WGZ7_PRUAR|nr:unnamed protein product [Prunus armeniaca]
MGLAQARPMTIVTPANLQTSIASDNLEHLYETPSTQAFDKLRQLKLVYLPMLSHIWEKGLHVSSGFGNLRILNVWAMEKIVGEAEGGGESIEDELTFLHWPALETVYVRQCPKLEAFAPESLYV